MPSKWGQILKEGKVFPLRVYPILRKKQKTKIHTHTHVKKNKKQKKTQAQVRMQNTDLQFYVLLTVFQSYQNDGWVIMKDCVQWKLFYDRKDSRFKRSLTC